MQSPFGTADAATAALAERRDDDGDGLPTATATKTTTMGTATTRPRPSDVDDCGDGSERTASPASAESELESELGEGQRRRRRSTTVETTTTTMGVSSEAASLVQPPPSGMTAVVGVAIPGLARWAAPIRLMGSVLMPTNSGGGGGCCGGLSQQLSMAAMAAASSSSPLASSPQALRRRRSSAGFGSRGRSMSGELAFEEFFEPAMSPLKSHRSSWGSILDGSLSRLDSTASSTTSWYDVSSLSAFDLMTIEDVKEIEESTCSHEGEPSITYTSTANEAGLNKIGPADFELLAVVGRGSFGKVFQVRKKDTGAIYAMKVMRKQDIWEKDHAEYVRSERDVLTAVEHPYIVHMYYSFQTSKKLYLVLEFINGGHLFYQLYKEGTFTQDRARLYTAELISAISFLHSKGILHRDLKPENVLLDGEGHIKVTDFGLCKPKMNDSSTRADSFVGTIQYMAPEIIKGQEHTMAVDWWSVGILLYEMLSGSPPFDYRITKGSVTEKDRKQLMSKIISAKLHKPKYCGKAAWSLLRGLLTKDPAQRLGSKGASEIKGHEFFKCIDWDKLERQQIVPTFKPAVLNAICIANFDKQFTDLPAVDSPCGTPDNPGLLGAFQGYSYQAPSMLDQTMQKLKCF